MQAEPTKKTLDIRREIRRCPTCALRFSRDAVFCPHDGTKLQAAAFEPLVDPLVGTTVDGRYEVLEVLGEGGMGRVYRVRHVALERAFAMKVLRRDLARDEDLGERFIHEAKATASIKHPNVVQINDFGKLPDGIPYFVMELLVGNTLGEVIKAGGPIPAGRAVRIIKQVARALGAAHAAGVVHRDLKPDNVFLIGGSASDPSEAGRARAMLGDGADVRVVDFGASKIVGSSRMTRTGIVFGTPHYMSPEQASGVPVDHRADIYALGIIMYEMFAGRVPFEADTYMGVLTQHMFVQPVPPSQVSGAAKELGALEQITLICLEKKPEDRFASMQDLVDALDRVVRVGEGGAMDIARRLDSAPHRAAASVRYRMADELEPPTLEEMRVAIDSVPPSTGRRRGGWIAAAGGTLVAGVAVLWALRSRSPREEAPLPATAASTTTAIATATATATAASTTTAIATATATAASTATTTTTTTTTTTSTAPALSASPSVTQFTMYLPDSGAVPTPHPPTPRALAPRPVPPRVDDVGDPFVSKR